MKFKSILSVFFISIVSLSCARLNSNLSSKVKQESSSTSRLVIKNYGTYLTDSQTSNSEPLQPLMGHVPLATQFSKDSGVVNEDKEFNISIVLSYNHETELQQTLDKIYDPANANFHKFLTTQEFQSQFYPTEEQVNTIKSVLSTQSFEIQPNSESRLIIHAKGQSKVIQSFFHTEIHRFEDSLTQQIYYAPLYELQVPKDLQIVAVHGLDSSFHANHHHFVESKQKGQRSGLNPTQIRRAYDLPAQLNGSGQVMALLELDGFTNSDIESYEKEYGLASVPLQTLLINGASGRAGEGAPEVTLDIELMIAVAPGADKILIYEGPNSANGILDTYSKIANDNLAKSISTSWGSHEGGAPSSFISSENKIFKQMAAQGQSFYAASGDSGAYDDGSTLSVDDPASQPYVTAVGGTTLTIGSDGSYEKETTWGDSSNGRGGGGGISSIWSIPSWQTGVISEASLGSKTMRNVPDVSLNADPKTGYSIYYGDKWVQIGGTSCAAPLWAAFTALVNQNRISKGLAVLGFPSPYLYKLGQGSTYSVDLHNIADGSTNLYYPAVAGFNDATGWGTIKGNSLLQSLSVN